MDIAVRTMQTQLRKSQSILSPFEAVASALTRKHSTADWFIRLITLILPTIFLTVIVIQPWVEAKWMFLDPLTAAELSGDCCHSHYGFVSTAGVILWAATTAISLFTAVLLFIARTQRELMFFPLLAGLLTGWITLDDAYLMHETVLPAFGVSQNLVIASIVLFALAYFVFNLRYIFKYDFWILAMGAAALAVSVAVDTIFHSLDANLVLLEDSAKFFGIFCWASFHITTFAKIISENLATTSGGRHD